MAIAQDEAGWIWLGGVDGLHRYDGARSVRWGGDFHGEPIQFLGIEGEAATVLCQDRRLYEVRREGWREVPGPGGGFVQHAARSDGRLWAVRDGGLHVRGDDGVWTGVATPFPARLVRPASHGVWALGQQAIARIGPDGAVFEQIGVARAMDLVEDGAGGYVATRELGVWRWDNGEVRQIFQFTDDAWGEGVRLAPGGAWVVTTRELIRFVGDRVAVTVPIPGGAPQHDALLVDREGSVWVGTSRGPRLRSTPDAVRLATPSAPDPWITWLHEDSGGVWAASWRAGGRFVDQRWEGAGYTGFSWPFCETPDGPVTLAWDPGEAALVRLSDRADVLSDRLPPGVWVGCSHRGDGLLVAMTSGVYRFVDGVFSKTEAPIAAPTALATERSGRVHLFGADQTCASATPTSGPWTCAPWSWPAPHGAVEVAPGRIWAFGLGMGLVEGENGRWAPHPGSTTLRSPTLRAVVPTGLGEAWILSLGDVSRVRLGGPLGAWTRLEPLGPAQGLPPSGANHLLERPDGSVWLATDEGVVVVPPAARRPPSPPPAPTLVEVRVDGREVDPAALAVAAWPHNQVEVRGASPTYRDRSRLRWRARVGRGPEVDGVDPTLRLVDLPAGTTEVRLEVSADGGATWSAPSAPLRLAVYLPWYRTPPAWIAASVLVLAGIVLAWKARVAALLRVERERTRIAMDLHDDLGAGLSTVTMLTGLAADPELPDDARREVAHEASTAASTLADAVAGIVWTLRRDAGTGEALARTLVERARRLFAGGRNRLVLDVASEWPARTLSLAKYRNLQLIGYEALANAARHAEASEVILRLHPWTLEILDDGRGLHAASPRAGTGTGLSSMEARARAIGATFSVTARPGGGTAVKVVFRP
jgi:signal transduction histidine kinase